MSKNRVVKLNINYGGSLEQNLKTYEYVGSRCLRKVVFWNLTKITWKKFQSFVFEQKMMTDIGLIWFKRQKEDMDKLQYAHDSVDDGFSQLLECARISGEIDVFIDHLLSDMGTMNKNKNNDDNHEYDAEDESEEHEREDYVTEEESDDEEIPKDDMDVEESENEAETGIGEAGTEETGTEETDVGEDVVPEAEIGEDTRFASLVEEAEHTRDAKKDKSSKDYVSDRSDGSEDEFCVGDEPYPDTPPNTDDEWERLKHEPEKRRGNNKFHGDYEKEPYLWLFQTFSSGDEFKSQLLRYALKTQYDVKMARSDGRRIAAVCTKENCKWKVYCSVETPIKKWMIKVCHNTHNHDKDSRVRMLRQGVIASLYREELRRKVYMTANEIKDSIKERYNIIVSRYKCSKARRIALDVVLEDQATQFAKLWDYEYELNRSNPGVKTDIVTVPLRGQQVFDKIYICFKELRETWKKCCRPVIGLDGCFCRWDLKGELLAAIGRDADNRIYPIAWAIVRGEDTESWTWFVNHLKEDLLLGEGEKLTIISDKQKGLVKAIADHLPRAEHRMCARHIYANWKKGYSSSEYKALFWTVAYAYNEGEYDERMKALYDYDKNAHEALLRTEPKNWCRAFFRLDSQCMDVHNNLSESFNRTIREARLKPIITLLEAIRRQTMERISKRQLQTDAWEGELTPITLKVLEDARVSGKYCSTIRSSATLYEVVEFDNGYTVSLATLQCACRRWDLRGIPCKHALCVINDNQVDVSKYVRSYFKSVMWKGNYERNIGPTNGEKLWKKLGKLPIGVPDFRRPPGRPKMYRRKKAPHEEGTSGKVTRHGRTIHCGNCGLGGHNKSRCKNAPKIDQPKNKRGRPRKNPQEVPVRRPPRTASAPKKTKHNTSTQPTNNGESATTAFPSSSSAPQPSTSTTKPKRKPRTLKVKKSVNIPPGYGILNCPYTGRVFDVWGNSARDLSSTSYEQPPP